LRPATRVPRIGILSLLSTPSHRDFEGLRQGLRELGFVDGQNVALEYRLANGQPERLPSLAAELVKIPVDVIVTESAAASAAAGDATRTIPIVIGTGAEAELGQAGRIATLAHPGGNVTGFILSPPGIHGKRLELFKEAIPSLSRVATILDANAPSTYRSETRAVAPSLGLSLQPLEIRRQDDLDGALDAAVRASADGLYVGGGPLFANGEQRIVEFAAAHRLPAIYTGLTSPGGLMSYAANAGSNFRRAAGYVVKILEGTKPGDLPVQQPTVYDFVINLKTARALGLTIPQSVLTQASEVIQ
jgi:putative ABC transport system substrate-binding protein